MPSGYRDTRDDFVRKAIAVHGVKYDYSKVVYVTSKVKVTVGCNTCGKEWEAVPNGHLTQRSGCPFCSGRFGAKERFFERAPIIHNNAYDYSLATWKGSRTKLEILCRRCEKSWWVTPCNHISRKSGCPRCSGHHKHTRDEYIKLAQTKHGDLYDYSRVTHFEAHMKAEIGCRRCDLWFYQDQTLHLHGNGKRGNGCPRCARDVKASSRYEVEWLDKLGVPLERRQHWMTLEGRNVCVDALWQNVAYEFLGKFWHGDPREYAHDKMNTLAGSTFGELYRKTLERLAALERFGFEVRFVWEKDYKAGLLFSHGHPVP